MDELYREDYWDKLPILVNVMNYLKDYKEKDPFKILKAFNVNKDFEKIISNYFSTKREELIKELLQREEKVQKAYSNADRIMAMDKQRRREKIENI